MANKYKKPVPYSDKLGDELCDRIADNQSLRTVCKADDMPHMSTVFKWLGMPEHADFKEKYILARQCQADATYEDIIAIECDVKAGQLGPKEARVIIDAMKWRAGKMRPSKYGDASKYTISGPDDGPIQTEQKHDSMNLDALQRVIRGEK